MVKRWTEQETKDLLFLKNLKTSELAVRFGRSRKSILKKFCRCGVSCLFKQSRSKVVKIPRRSKEFAYFLGILASDGHVAKKEVVVVTKYTYFKDKICEQMKGLFGRCSVYYYNNTFRITMSSKQLSQYLGDWSYEGWPDTVDNRFAWLKKEPYVWSFLAGYFDGDGTVNVQKYCRFAIQPIKVQNWMSSLLDACGVRNNVDCKGVAVSFKSKKFYMRLLSSLNLEHKRIAFEVIANRYVHSTKANKAEVSE